MNPRTAKKLRGQAAQAAINCLPSNYTGKPNERRRFELHIGNAVYKKLKSMGGMERSKLSQVAVDKIAHNIAMPSTRKKEKRSKLTKNQAKAERKQARG